MGMIQEFQKADRERRREVKQLEDEVANRLKEFAEGDKKRASAVAIMHSEADTLVKDFTKGSAQRASEIADKRSAVATLLKDLKAQTQERKAEVAAIAKEATAIIEAADTFVKDLARGSAQRASETADKRSAVATLLKDLKAQTQEHKAEVATLHKIVWGKAPAKTIMAASKVAPPGREPTGEVPPAAPVAKQAAAGELRDRVFAYLANHPDGTRLTELEEKFGVARIQIARVIRELIDDKKVEKRELLYYAI